MDGIKVERNTHSRGERITFPTQLLGEERTSTVASLFAYYVCMYAKVMAVALTFSLRTPCTGGERRGQAKCANGHRTIPREKMNWKYGAELSENVRFKRDTCARDDVGGHGVPP